MLQLTLQKVLCRTDMPTARRLQSAKEMLASMQITALANDNETNGHMSVALHAIDISHSATWHIPAATGNLNFDRASHVYAFLPNAKDSKEANLNWPTRTNGTRRPSQDTSHHHI
jgi:hypothetical protein